jgi:hypothetical protein
LARATDLTAERDALDAMDEVGGRAVGSGGGPSPFYTLGRSFVVKGTAADFRRMANDKVPVVRAMGLYCLTITRADGAADVLRAHLRDDGGPFGCMPGGCVGTELTVGRFARHLLRDRNYLEFADEPDPVIPAYDLLAEDVRMLAADGPAADAERLEFDPTRTVHWQLDKGRVSLDDAGLKALAAAAAGEPRWRLIKGLGRATVRPVPGELLYGIQPAVRRLLLARLADQAEDPRTRLAAASALTRDPDPSALPAIRAAGDFLGRATDDRDLGTKLAAAAELRVRLNPLPPPRPAGDLLGGGLGGDEVLPDGSRPRKRDEDALRSADHPMVLEYLLGRGIFSRPHEMRLSARQLGHLAARVHEFGRAWDTYSDAVFVLRDAAVPAEDDVKEFDQGAYTRLLNRAIRERDE